MRGRWERKEGRRGGEAFMKKIAGFFAELGWKMIREARERKPMCGMVLRGIRDEKN